METIILDECIGVARLSIELIGAEGRPMFVVDEWRGFPPAPVRVFWDISFHPALVVYDTAILAYIKPTGDSHPRPRIKPIYSEIHEMMDQLAEYLRESHAGEVDTDHGGDGTGDCSYCKALEEAEALSRRAGGAY